MNKLLDFLTFILWLRNVSIFKGGKGERGVEAPKSFQCLESLKVLIQPRAEICDLCSVPQHSQASGSNNYALAMELIQTRNTEKHCI